VSQIIDYRPVAWGRRSPVRGEPGGRPTPRAGLGELPRWQHSPCFGRGGPRRSGRRDRSRPGIDRGR